MIKTEIYDILLGSNNPFPTEEEIATLRLMNSEFVTNTLFEIVDNCDSSLYSKACEALLKLNPYARKSFILYAFKEINDNDFVITLRRISETEYSEYRSIIWERINRIANSDVSICVAACGMVRDLGNHDDYQFLLDLSERIVGFDWQGNKASDIILDYANQVLGI